MKITINNKQYAIKQAHNLTVSEYLQLMENSDINIANYLHVTTGEDFKTILKTNANEQAVRTLKNYIGEIKTLTDFTDEKIKSFTFDGRKYKAKEMPWQAVGMRIMFEQRINKTQNVYALAVYILAVLIEGNFEAEEAEKVYSKLLERDYLEIMPTAIFFFAKLNHGYWSDSALLRVLKMIMKTLTNSIGAQQGWQSSINMQR